METAALDAVLTRHPIAVAYLFGSRAAGTARSGSDHDVAVLFSTPVDLGEVGALQAGLVTALGTPVDLVELDRAPLRRARPVRGRAQGSTVSAAGSTGAASSGVVAERSRR